MESQPGYFQTINFINKEVQGQKRTKFIIWEGGLLNGGGGYEARCVNKTDPEFIQILFQMDANRFQNCSLIGAKLTPN